MSRSSVSVATFGTALTIAGCSIFGSQPDPAPSPVATPLSAIRHGAGHTDAHYALGRYYQGQIRYDEAIRSYQEVLAARPDHADAHNALGVVYAIQGRHALAEKELRAAVELAPGAAHIHNNLGYALLLAGRAAESIPAFETALRLEPANSRAADNLRKAQASREGQPVVASVPAGKIAGSAVLASSLGKMAYAVPPPRLSAVAANVYELRAPRPVGNHEKAKPLPIRENLARVRLEIANGNGVEGLARRTSTYLLTQGYGQSRLTNQKPFSQGRTEIQFRPGLEAEARRLQNALAGKGVMAPSSQMHPDIQMRVVLGRDLRSMAQLDKIQESGPPRRLARSED